MFDTVECPYCEHENSMSEGLVDLPSDNKFDHECENCEREFEVFVEFTPSYSGVEIEYVKCEKCGDESRDVVRKGRTFPYPENMIEVVICRPCYRTAMSEQYSKR